jgi:hypothetical protein
VTAEAALIEQLATTQRGIAHALKGLASAVADIAAASETHGQVLGRIADPAAAMSALDGACFSVYLHGNYHWLTRQMTTEEKEAFADACDRHVLTWPPADQGTRMDRWWRGDAVLPVTERTDL